MLNELLRDDLGRFMCFEDRENFRGAFQNACSAISGIPPITFYLWHGFELCYDEFARTAFFRHKHGNQWLITYFYDNVVCVKHSRSAVLILKGNGTLISHTNDFDQHVFQDVREAFVNDAGLMLRVHNDGDAYVWGNDRLMPDLEVQELLTEVVQVVARDESFAVLREDGTVVSLHLDNPELSGVESLASAENTYAALKRNGEVVCWGLALDYDSYAGRRSLKCVSDFFKIEHELKEIDRLISTPHFYMALRGDGHWFIWGLDHPVEESFGDVKDLAFTDRAFAVLKRDGTVAVGGEDEWGGSLDDEKLGSLVHVKKVVASKRAFCALKDDGSVITWGDENHGGDTWGLGSQLKDVTDVVARDDGFIATRRDNTTVYWGKGLVRRHSPVW